MPVLSIFHFWPPDMWRLFKQPAIPEHQQDVLHPFSSDTAYLDLFQTPQGKGSGSKACPPPTPVVAQTVKHLPSMPDTWVQSQGWKNPLEKELATHSSILAWIIPWTEEPGGLQSTGSRRVKHDWATNTFFHFPPTLDTNSKSTLPPTLLTRFNSLLECLRDISRTHLWVYYKAYSEGCTWGARWDA